MRRVLKFFGWENMSREVLTADLIAGFTCAMLLIPQSMAYAGLAGLPAYYGLYAAFIPVILSGLFGHLHQLGTGPVAMTSIITASVVTAYAAPGSEEYISIVLVLSLLVGIIRLLMGLLKMAAVVNLISHPVVSGFTCAGAMIIGLSQLPKMFGITIVSNQGFLGNMKNLAQLIGRLGETHVPTLVIGLAALIIIFLMGKFASKVPAVLVVVVLSIIVSSLIGFEAKLGGSVIGVVPKGLPKFNFIITAFTFSEWMSLIAQLLPGAIVITLISFMEVLSVSKAVAAQTKQRLDLNKELIGQGISSIGGSFFSSYPVSGSFSRTALNLMAGAKTGLSSVFTGLIVMVMLLFFTPLLYHLPNAVLAASIIVAVRKLINFTPMVRSLKANRVHGVISFATFAGTLAFAPDMHYGVILGVVLTILAYLVENMRPKAVVVERYEDGTLRDAGYYELPVDDHVVIVRIDSSLNFLNNSYFSDFITNVVAERPSIRSIVIVGIGINRIDSSGEWALKQIASDLEEQGIGVVFAGFKRASLDTIKSTNLFTDIGEEHFFRNINAAIDYANNRWSDRYSKELTPVHG